MVFLGPVLSPVECDTLLIFITNSSRNSLYHSDKSAMSGFTENFGRYGPVAGNGGNGNDWPGSLVMAGKSLESIGVKWAEILDIMVGVVGVNRGTFPTRGFQSETNRRQIVGVLLLLHLHWWICFFLQVMGWQ